MAVLNPFYAAEVSVFESWRVRRRIYQARVARSSELNLSNLGLESLPAEIGSLTFLTTLDLRGNGLTSLPTEIGNLTALTTLDLRGNGLTSLPAQIGNLTALTTLHLRGSGLTSLPAEIGNLTALTALDLSGNRLTSLPTEIGNLTALMTLDLSGNRLTSLPTEIGNLTALTTLDLGLNWLTSLPTEIGGLTALTALNLNSNRLTSLPTEIGNLTALTWLELARNRLTSLPTEMGNLAALAELGLVGNGDLVNPPPAVLGQGTSAVLAFLRELTGQALPQWRSKVMVVGQGGAGKTSLVKALTGAHHDPGEPITHGLGIVELDMAHPRLRVGMRLSVWDFGGQEIYHATHQFFLTGQALFMLVWNARAGYADSQLRYWLDLIQARAPRAPVLIVATHTAARPADLPLAELRTKFPNIVEHLSVDNSSREGIEQVRERVGQTAADLPLMGQRWPATWLAAQDACRASSHTHVTLGQLFDMLADAGVTNRADQNALIGALHDLGVLLHWAGDSALESTVVLKPQWLSTRISSVLDSHAVKDRGGLLRSEDLQHHWPELDSTLRQQLLHMMDRYDVSYRVVDDNDDSALALVVDRLPWEATDYLQTWDPLAPPRHQQIRLRYQFDSILPPGIPTWFIAREHRFSIAEHRPWRTGALLRHHDGHNYGLINTSGTTLDLTVRGPDPEAFLHILDDGLHMTLRRYPGLKVTRSVPCLCDPGCTNQHDYELLRLWQQSGATDIPCIESKRTVNVGTLLRGLPTPIGHLTGDPSTLGRLEHKIDALLSLQGTQTELLQRLFTELRNTHTVRCPSVFTIVRTRRIPGTSTTYTLRLYCEHPGAWHPLPGDEGTYTLTELDPWLQTAIPHMNRIARILSTAAAFTLPILGIAGTELTKKIKEDLAEVKDLLELAAHTTTNNTICGLAQEPGRQASIDADYRAIAQLLHKLDPQERWGSLSREHTPEGHILYLCRQHIGIYQKPSDITLRSTGPSA